MLKQKEQLLKLSLEQHAALQAAVSESFSILEPMARVSAALASHNLSNVEPTSKPMVRSADSTPRLSSKVVALGDVPEFEQLSATPDEHSDLSSEITHQLTESEKHGPNGTESKAEASTGRNHLSPIESVTASANESPGGSQSLGTERPKRSSKFSKATTVGVLLGKAGESKRQQELLHVITHYIDYVAGGLVLINSFALMLQLELEGRQLAYQIGMPQGDNFEDVLPVFRVVDSVFVFIFFAELLLRIFVERTKFLKDVANWLDTVLVVGGLVDIFVSMNAQSEDVATLRFVTALKAFRAIRMVRSFRFFRGLRGLVKACQCCLPSLCWSMVLLAVFMCMGGLIMGNLLQDFIKDESNAMEDRQWVWQHYGTCYRATYTLYEMTFAGNWPVNARPVLEKVSHAFVIFYLLYITIIVFAVIRVISAIFLKDTLDEAHNDAQQLVLDRLKKKADYVQRLEGLFRTIDDSGQGMITEERLQEMLDNPKVKAYLQTLEIDVHEGHALFHLLDNGDGEVTLEEFTGGLMRCKGPARAIDAVALHSDLRQLDAKMNKLIVHLKESRIIRSKSRSHHGAGRRSQAEHMKVFRLDPAAELRFTNKASDT